MSDLVVFHNDNIYVLTPGSDDEFDVDEHAMEDDCYETTNTPVTDIYSDEHVWDTCVRPSYRFRPDIWCTLAYDTDE